MQPRLPNHAKYQFSLRALLITMTSAAVLLGAWMYLLVIREQRRLTAQIQTLDWLPADQRALFCNWVCHRRAWGLLKEIGVLESDGQEPGMPVKVREEDDTGLFVRELRWQSKFVNVSREERHVFVFGGFQRQNQGLIILSDGACRPLVWSLVPMGGSFRAARQVTKNGCDVLEIDAGTVGMHSQDNARGIYRFALTDTEVQALPVEWTPTEIEKTYDAMCLLKDRVIEYMKSEGRLPSSLADLPPWPGYMDSNHDGWGREIELCVKGDRVTLKSYGEDGMSGGTGNGEDLVGEFDAKLAEGELDTQPDQWIRDPLDAWMARPR